MNANSPIDPKNQPHRNNVSMDALADDLFGLNWRAIRTLAVSLTDPRQFSEAAWSVNWQDRFTPSFRLWFTLVAILLFFQFFWADADGAIIAMYSAQLESSAVNLPQGVSIQDASVYFARINFTVLPFASAFSLFVFGALYRAWGEMVPLVVRIRYVFAVSVPSTALALPIFWMLGVAPPEQATPYMILSWILPIPLDLWVAYRGVFSKLQGFPRLWRSLVLALALFATMMTGSVVSSFLTGAWISLQHGV